MDAHRLDNQELGEVLAVALRAGQIMLENGANMARVEETVTRFGTALGAERLDVFATPTGIVTTAIAQELHRTRIVRVLKTGIDLNRVAAVNSLAERASSGELNRAQLRDALEQIARAPRRFGDVLTVLAVGMGCACFALLFGGNAIDAGVAGVASSAGQALREWLGRLQMGRLAMTFLVTLLAAGLGLVGARVLGTPEPGLALAASVLLLVPGVLMVSSVADLFRGDTLSGLSRATSAVLVVAVVGAGLYVVLLVSGLDLALSTNAPPPLVLAILFALAATVGFAVLFDVPRRALLPCALVGAVGYAVRGGSVLLAPALPPEGAMFLAGFAIVLLSEPISYALRMPTSIFVIPGFIPLVPGVLAFRTVLELAAQDYTAGTATLVQTALRVGALAAGIGTSQALTRRKWWPITR
ncbi:threonine/serine exporter family protein [Archangium minus]|uniref:Threonine/serine exporter family protein n=1 Tax=Archangium minus TaxID=83450 RepID=A0ABY9X0C0_9BACT|nr:threonine/serine exporter family protein [Archangium minus]